MLLNGELDRANAKPPTVTQPEAVTAELFSTLPGFDEDIIMVKESKSGSAKEPAGKAKAFYTSPNGRDYKKKVNTWDERGGLIHITMLEAVIPSNLMLARGTLNTLE